MIIAAGALLSLCLCGLYMKKAAQWELADIPNERSSHVVPTPHGGGVGIITALLLCVIGGFFSGIPWRPELGFITFVALILCIVGVLDDKYDLSARLRLLVYGALISLCVLVIVPFAAYGLAGSVFLAAGAVLALLWLTNLYNFMDGIDALAALQAILACGAAAYLVWSFAGGETYVLYLSLFAACHLGFLFWNFPPARLFMGDAGSVPTGFVLGALALYGHWQGLLPIACWLILLAVFITDATYTLIWRFADGQVVTEAHRSHAYQRLSRHFNSHLAVVAIFVLLFVFWLFPCALAAVIWPQAQALLVILVYVPLVIVMFNLRQLGFDK
ncbi:MAG: glycosyl transferase [Gammaproteobacteria bacterium]|nr:MAG: glycosyl transferase [Gammaproteobacteria bacterium]PIE37100.1 MAG: glycosyl transferase [Gammaproteobacteria bacterium]